MNNADKIRTSFLMNVPKIIDRVSKAYTENTAASQLTKQEQEILKHIWPTVSALILQADDLTKVEGLSSGTITEKVDKVLEHVANGKLTIQQGKRLIEMLQAGFNITELPELMQKMAELDGK